MTEEYGNIPDAFYLSQKEIEELRNKKHELTEYGKQKLKELMDNDKDLIFRDNGKETFRLSSDFALGKKVPETKLEIKMTEPLHAKVSEEDYQKVLDAFNNPQPYPDEMLAAVEVALEKQKWERTVRKERILQRYNEYHNLETSGLPHGQPITVEHQQIIAFESMIDALRCEHLNQEYTHIAIADIEDLIEGLRNQANEFLERVRTVQKPSQESTKTDLDAL